MHLTLFYDVRSTTQGLDDKQKSESLSEAVFRLDVKLSKTIKEGRTISVTSLSIVLLLKISPSSAKDS